jgi:hypothetical protein
LLRLAITSFPRKEFNPCSTAFMLLIGWEI